MNLMQLPHEQGKNQDIEVDVVLPLFVSFLTCNRTWRELLGWRRGKGTERGAHIISHETDVGQKRRSHGAEGTVDRNINLEALIPLAEIMLKRTQTLTACLHFSKINIRQPRVTGKLI